MNEKLKQVGQSLIDDYEFNELLVKVKDFEYKNFDNKFIPHLYVYMNRQEDMEERECAFVAIDPESNMVV